MQSVWYYYRDGKQYGPVSTGELERMIKYGRLTESDSVRLISGDELISVTEIMAIFSGKTDTTATAADSAARLLSHSSPLPSVHTQSPKGVSRLLQSVFSYLTDFSHDVISSLFDKLVRAASFRNAIITLAAVALVAVVYVFKDLTFGGSDTRAAIDQMLAINDQLDRLQMLTDSSTEWTTFQADSLASLASLRKQLETSASRSPRSVSSYWTTTGYHQSVARSHLIQACQALIMMVKDHGGDDRLRAHLHQRLGLAETQLAFNPINDFERTNPIDPLTVGIVLVDILAAIGAGVLWWRRSR